jgi:hypothetical protein
MRPNRHAEMTMATSLAGVEGHTFHKRLSRNTLITSSEAAPKKNNGPAKRTNSPGLLTNSLKRYLTLAFERD